MQTPSRSFEPRASRCALLVVGFAALAGACADGPTEPGSSDLPAADVRAVSAPVLSSTRESSPLMSVSSCAAGAVYKLTDLRYTVGTVTVTNDAEKLYVTYQITKKDWFISDTRLAVARKYDEIPQDERRRPLPWSFPYAGEHEPVVRSATYAIPLAELGVGGGDKIVVAAMAGVVWPTTGKYEGPWEWRVMWGLGNISGRSVETIHNYTINGCAKPLPPPSSGAGIFTLTFDDGYLSTYTHVYPLLKDMGMKGNVAVNPQPIDLEWNGYMSLAQLKDLHKAGWSIVSHSVTHRDLTTLSDAEIEAELRDSKAWVARNGFGPTDVFVVPFHSWGERERTAIARHYTRARGFTVNQFVPPLFAKYPVTKPLDLTGYEPEFAPFTTAEGRAQTVAYVKRAVEQGEFIDLFFHRITDAQLPAFRTLMQQLAPYKDRLRTWGEFGVAATP